MTWTQIQEEAKMLLVHCSEMTISEHIQHNESPNASVNEAFGMATRALAEQADNLQAFADAVEESHGGA